MIIEVVVIFTLVSNVIYLKFHSKKHFPPGKWQSEPDYCKWNQYDLVCLALRDMSMGIWRGFVGLDKDHPCYGQSVEDIIKAPSMIEAFVSVYGGIVSAGHLPPRYEVDAKKYWWVGIETAMAEDLFPLLNSDPEIDEIISGQVYKDLFFIRRETKKLAKYLSKIR